MHKKKPAKELSNLKLIEVYITSQTVGMKNWIIWRTFVKWLDVDIRNIEQSDQVRSKADDLMISCRHQNILDPLSTKN